MKGIKKECECYCHKAVGSNKNCSCATCYKKHTYSPKPQEKKPYVVTKVYTCGIIHEIEDRAIERFQKWKRRMYSPKPTGTKSLKEIHKIVDEIREEIENPKPTKIEKLIEEIEMRGITITMEDISYFPCIESGTWKRFKKEINKLKLSH